MLSVGGVIGVKTISKCRCQNETAIGSSKILSRSFGGPFVPQLLRLPGEAQTVRSFKYLPANPVIRPRSLRVAVGTEWHTGVIRGLHRHPTIIAGVRRLGLPFDSARAAGERSNPSLVAFVARGTFTGRSVTRPNSFFCWGLAIEDNLGKVRL